MPSKTWLLTDSAQRIFSDTLSITPGDLATSTRGWSVSKQTLRGGPGDGVDVVRIDNGAFAVEVLPTRGMSLWKGWLGDLEIGWQSPVAGPVHPGLVPIMDPTGLGWLEGFDELLVRCGLESNGAPEFDAQGSLRYPLHGRIGNLPAQRVSLSIDDDSGEISLTGVVEETRFHFRKLRLTSTLRTRPGEPGFRLHDQVENLSARPGEFQLLYHINFGAPLLEDGCRCLAPARTVVPRNSHAAAGVDQWANFGGPQAGYEEQVYFMELLGAADGSTQTLLRNAAGDRGVSLHFNTRQLPCFTLWKNTVATTDGYVTGLEPGVNFPNPRSHEAQHGRVVPLAPGATASVDLRLEIHADATGVARAEAAIAGLQGGVEPLIFPHPQAGWCAL